MTTFLLPLLQVPARPVVLCAAVKSCASAGREAKRMDTKGMRIMLSGEIKRAGAACRMGDTVRECVCWGLSTLWGTTRKAAGGCWREATESAVSLSQRWKERWEVRNVFGLVSFLVVLSAHLPRRILPGYVTRHIARALHIQPLLSTDRSHPEGASANTLTIRSITGVHAPVTRSDVLGHRMRLRVRPLSVTATRKIYLLGTPLAYCHFEGRSTFCTRAARNYRCNSLLVSLDSHGIHTPSSLTPAGSVRCYHAPPLHFVFGT